ncbi:hypothetical protein SNEBB_004671, partial [Seison nebaliae]
NEFQFPARPLKLFINCQSGHTPWPQLFDEWKENRKKNKKAQGSMMLGRRFCESKEEELGVLHKPIRESKELVLIDRHENLLSIKQRGKYNQKFGDRIKCGKFYLYNGKFCE